MSFPRYPAYKNSGVEWLGQVPEHWKSSRFSRFIRSLKDGTHGSFQRVSEGEPLLSAKNVTDSGLHIGEEESLISLEDYSLIISNGFPRKDDLLLTIVGTIGRSCVYKLERPMAFQRSVCFIRLAKSHEPQYFHYFIQSKCFQDQLVSRAKAAAQGGVYMGEVAATMVSCPSPGEQIAISGFLDHETAKIDALIAEQQRLIELLQEKRQAVISDAVTKGLNPDAPLKDSGVEWLGEVPEHWDVSHLAKQSNLLQTGPFGSQLGAEDYVIDGIPVINPSSIIGSNITAIDGVGVAFETACRLERHKLRKGDLVVARRGEMGRCAVVGENEIGWLCGTGCLLLRCKRSFNPGYVELVIKSEYSRAALSLSSVGSTMENLNTSILGRLRVPVPPKEDQVAILDYLQQSERCFESLITEASNAIRLLEERRSALISAAVTGQIDVRSLVPEAVAA